LLIPYFLKLREKINNIFSYIIILYAFVMPIDVSKSYLITKVMFVLWILSFDYKETYFTLRTNRLLQAILLLSALIAISYLWSSIPIDESTSHQYYAKANHYMYNYLRYYLVPLLIIVTKLKKEMIPIVIGSFLFSMFINEVISYGISFKFWKTPHGTPSDPIPFHINHITYSTFIGFAILLSIYKFAHIKNYFLKSFYLIFLITMSINLFMSAGRTGQVALFLTLIILGILHINNNKKLLYSFIILIIVSASAYFNINTFHNRVNQAYNDVSKIIHNKNPDTSLGTRIMAFKTIPYLVNEDNILFGVGIGDKASYISTTLKKDFPYRLHNFDNHGYLHNYYLKMLVSNGIIGLTLYLLIYYYLFKLKTQTPFIIYISHSLGIYIFFYGLNADLFFFQEVMSLFALFLGIIIVDSLKEENVI